MKGFIRKRYVHCIGMALIVVMMVLCTRFSSHADMKELKESKYCSFIVPSGFGPTDTPGTYVNEFYPLESANVTYKMTLIPQDKILTNAQKAAGEDASGTDEDLLYDELTKEMYEEIQAENYTALYGENIGFKVEDFKDINIDDFPGYMITTSFTPEDSEKIHQTVIIVLSKNKVYTVVYSRAEDDDFDEAFIDSIASIHVVQ